MHRKSGNKIYSIGEVARLSGVSVRALHHYHDLKLLEPALIGRNGYRYYGREQLLRLQQILFHRELGMSLEAIGAVLDAPGFDRLRALHRQRERVSAEIGRLRRLLDTIDHTIAECEGKATMNEDELYSGFSPEKQEEYEAYLVERYGPETRRHIEAGRQWRESSPQAWQTFLEDLATIGAELGDAYASGIAPDDESLEPLMRRHHAWVRQGWRHEPSAEAYAGLGELYNSHPDFVARFDAYAPGLSAWLEQAMKSFAARCLTT